MNSSASVKLRYENCLQVWGNAIGLALAECFEKCTLATMQKTYALNRRMIVRNNAAVAIKAEPQYINRILITSLLETVDRIKTANNTIAICPTSTPMLKATIECRKFSADRPSELKAPANPTP